MAVQYLHWFNGTIVEFRDGYHKVKFDDGDERSFILKERKLGENFKFLDTEVGRPVKLMFVQSDSFMVFLVVQKADVFPSRLAQELRKFKTMEADSLSLLRTRFSDLLSMIKKHQCDSAV